MFLWLVLLPSASPLSVEELLVLVLLNQADLCEILEDLCEILADLLALLLPPLQMLLPQ